jgi:hypothetical protein
LIIDMADLYVATLAWVRRLVVIAATWGEGEPANSTTTMIAARIEWKDGKM